MTASAARRTSAIVRSSSNRQNRSMPHRVAASYPNVPHVNSRHAQSAIASVPVGSKLQPDQAATRPRRPFRPSERPDREESLAAPVARFVPPRAAPGRDRARIVQGFQRLRVADSRRKHQRRRATPPRASNSFMPGVPLCQRQPPSERNTFRLCARIYIRPALQQQLHLLRVGRAIISAVVPPALRPTSGRSLRRAAVSNR